ncbi:unnamed protein product, partial [marine sediment metagenome]
HDFFLLFVDAETHGLRHLEHPERKCTLIA